MINKPTINKNPTKINRALLSVFDKTGIIELAKTLISHNVEILSTGGTAKTLRENNIDIVDVSDFTNFPEIMDGRVKTINPLIEGGILGLRDKHSTDAADNNIQWIDLVVCNLYPFSKAISERDCDLSLALENVDIGGPTMIRSAAKNVGWVTVCIDTNDYSEITDSYLEEKYNEFLNNNFDFNKILLSKYPDEIQKQIKHVIRYNHTIPETKTPPTTLATEHGFWEFGDYFKLL